MTIAWRAAAEATDADPCTRPGRRRMANPIKAMALRVHVRLAAWRARRQLARLDDRLLRDIGVDRAEVGSGAGDLRGIADMLAMLLDPPDRRR